MTDTSVIFDILAKDKASGTMGKVGGAAKSMLKMFAVGAAVDGIKNAIGAASDLNETQSKVNVLFGSGSSALTTWASGAATAMGQSKQQALDAAATFGVFGKSAGLSGGALSGFSEKMTGLAGDMASFSNTTPQEAIDAIGSAMQGEMEPIRKYGVLLDDASMRSQALKMGLIKTTTQALTPQQKVLTAQALILKQTGAAQGDFARTSGGLANQQRIMAAQFDNAKTSLGAGLLPIMTMFVSLVAKIVPPIADFIQHNKILTGVLAGLVIGVWALNIALDANPIVLIALGIVALIAVIAVIAVKTKFFQTLWKDAWGAIKAAGEAVWTGLKAAAMFVFDFLKAIVLGYWHFYSGIWIMIGKAGLAVWGLLKDGATGAFHWVSDKVSSFVGFFEKLPGRIAGAARGLFDGIKNAFKGAINWIISGWNRLHFTMPSFNTHIPGIGTVGGFNLGMPQIPLLAAGGTVVRAGEAVVGDAGPERVVLPAGASVVPLSRPGPAPGVVEVRVAGGADSELATFLHALARRGILQFVVVA